MQMKQLGDTTLTKIHKKVEFDLNANKMLKHTQIYYYVYM